MILIDESASIYVETCSDLYTRIVRVAETLPFLLRPHPMFFDGHLIESEYELTLSTRVKKVKSSPIEE